MTQDENYRDGPATIEDAAAALEQALTSGADLDKFAAMGAAYAAEGVEPEDAIEAAADWYDLTGGRDAGREEDRRAGGWS